MPRKKRRLRKSVVMFITILIECSLIAALIWTGYKIHETGKTKPEVTETPKTIPSAVPSSSIVPSATPAEELPSEFTDTNSVLIIANKKHKLPDGYVPSDLRQVNVQTNGNSIQLKNEAASALEQMFAAAANDGITLIAGSAYRSEEYQAQLYNQYASKDGIAAADEYSSRPGYSDHQTGLAVDISDHDQAAFLTQNMINTPEGQWLYQHAHEYGFILRYPQGKEAITGYEFEPWHYRYVGVSNAQAIYSVSPDETMEEFYNISGGDYAD